MRRGQGFVEYSLILGLIAVVALGAYSAFTPAIGSPINVVQQARVPSSLSADYGIRLVQVGDKHDYVVVHNLFSVAVTHAVGCRECAKLNK